MKKIRSVTISLAHLRWNVFACWLRRFFVGIWYCLHTGSKQTNNAFQYHETGYKCQQNCNINNIQQNQKKDRKKNECDNGDIEQQYRCLDYGPTYLFKFSQTKLLKLDQQRK